MVTLLLPSTTTLNPALGEPMPQRDWWPVVIAGKPVASWNSEPAWQLVFDRCGSYLFV